SGIVDENVERVDLLGRPLDLRATGYVQRYGRHTAVGALQRAARSRIDLLRSPSERLIDERLADAAVAAGVQDCFLSDVHSDLLCEICISVCYYGSRTTEDTRKDSLGDFTGYDGGRSPEDPRAVQIVRNTNDSIVFDFDIDRRCRRPPVSIPNVDDNG